MFDFLEIMKLPIILVLDNVRSLHNVGSIFRSADAFGIAEIWLCGITGTPPNKEIEKTALGATETVSWKYFPSTMEALRTARENNCTIIGIEQSPEAILLQNFIPENSLKYVLIFGNEVKGVEKEALILCEKILEIPQFGSKHSLNVAVSAGIVLWEFSRQLRK
jgi:23S rRNA (guanosine2251-2'-O)-methyltransferase